MPCLVASRIGNQLHRSTSLMGQAQPLSMLRFTAGSIMEEKNAGRSSVCVTTM